MVTFFESEKDMAAKGEAFHMLFPKYSEPLNLSTASMAIETEDTFISAKKKY